MPAESKAQFRLMQALAHGATLKKGTGLSKKEAREFIAHQSSKGLPERKGKTAAQTRRPFDGMGAKQQR